MNQTISENMCFFKVLLVIIFARFISILNTFYVHMSTSKIMLYASVAKIIFVVQQNSCSYYRDLSIAK